MAYKHTQRGTLVIAALGVAFLVTVLGGISEEGWGVTLLVMIILGGCLGLFSNLTVAIENDFVLCQFGPVGLIKKRIPLYEIKQVRPVRNSWLAGWGIRWLLGGTTMWNVSGFDAVELTLKSGKRFRIGTDQPQELAQALQSVIASYK